MSIFPTDRLRLRREREARCLRLAEVMSLFNLVSLLFFAILILVTTLRHIPSHGQSFSVQPSGVWEVLLILCGAGVLVFFLAEQLLLYKAQKLERLIAREDEVREEEPATGEIEGGPQDADW